MTKQLFLSSFNEGNNLQAIFEETDEKAWLYLCASKDGKENSSEVLADVFVCNTVKLLEHKELERYKPNLPPITKNFGSQDAVCKNISKVNWELIWLDDKSILLKKDQAPWALITLQDKRGMCKGIKKSGPWGDKWNEEKYQKICS